MDKIKNNLNSIGLILAVASWVGWVIWPQHKSLFFVTFLAGLAGIVVYIVLHVDIFKQKLKRKSFLYSTNMLLIVALVLAILVLANIFLSEHNYRMDFTESKLHSLSDQSVTVLKALEEDINIKGFFREGNYSRAGMENILKIYNYHSSRIKFEFIDPDKNPGLVKRYDVTQDGTTILESGEKESRITSTTEEDITNAIIQVTREKKKIIYFLEGHGEGSIEEAGDNGLSTVKSELEKLGYEVQSLSLALEDTFPQDVSCLVIPGPQKDLLPHEEETVRAYIRRGGRLAFMIDPESAPGMISFLSEYGILLENDLIVDTVSRLLGGDYFMPVVSEYEFHTITDGFRYATFFPFARTIEISETKPEGVTLTALAKTSPNSWSERDLAVQEVTFDEEKDRQGPLNLAVVATIAGGGEDSALPSPESEAEETEQQPDESLQSDKEGRLAVFGDSDFVKNRYYALSGNGNFFLNTLNWLTEEADLISIQPKTQMPRSIQLTPSQGRLLFFVSVIMLPLAVLILGISVWIRRRTL